MNTASVALAPRGNSVRARRGEAMRPARRSHDGTATSQKREMIVTVAHPKRVPGARTD
jgi:hypothetical protein